MNSITRNNVKITIGTSELYGEISKHLAPVIVNQILMKKRLSGPIAKVQNIFVYSPLGIIAGLQKPKTDFKTGDIAFYASNGSICLFKKDTRIKTKMTLIGKITKNINKLNDIKSGEILIIEILSEV